MTILRKREAYRKAFADFEVEKVAAFTEQDIERCVQDAGIVRNRLKINSAVSNARCFMEVQAEFGSFANYFWAYVDGEPLMSERGRPVTTWAFSPSRPTHNPIQFVANV